MKYAHYSFIFLVFAFKIANAQHNVPISVKDMVAEIESLKKDVYELRRKQTNSHKNKNLSNNYVINKNSKIIINSPDNTEGYICISYSPKSQSSRLRLGTLMSVTSNGLDYEVTDSTNKERIVGVLSGVGLNYFGKNNNLIAVHGIVKVRVVCRQGTKIKAGDLLCCSDASGIAMKTDQNNHHMGTIIGKSLEPYDNCYTEGLITMLILPK